MLIKIIEKIKSIFIIFVKKIRYGNKLILHNDFLKIHCKSHENIYINKGKIEVFGKLNMEKNSRISANKGGKIIIKGSCSFNTNSICVSMGNISIGSNVAIGPNVCIYDHDHLFDKNGKVNDKYKIGKVEIGNNVWIGAGSIILRNTTIGDNTIIGAGSVIKGDIPSNCIVTNDRHLIIKELETRDSK